MTRTWPVSGVALALLWLFVRGVSLSPDRIAAEGLIGLALGLPVAYGARRLYPPEIDLPHYLRAAPYALLYAVVFLRDLVVANFDVAYRVLAPSMPIRPATVVFRLRVEKDIAITTIANSITLTPGTLTMDYDEERHALVVHAIDGRDPEALKRPIRRWEEYALVIFDEELKPGDPVPERSVAAEEGEGTDRGVGAQKDGETGGTSEDEGGGDGG